MKPGLRTIRSLLGELSHPEGSYPIVHIAGTNGKGSTASMIASILTASGYRTGLYTSPHLVRFHERIRVDGREISDWSLARLTERLRAVILSTGATFFEATTAIALKYFQERKVDVAVVETGLGGRYDATNAVTSVLAVITTVGLDHTEQLGPTTRSIAFQKGGIIKPHVPCLTAVRDPGALSVLGAIARRKDAPLIHALTRSSFRVTGDTLAGLVGELRTPSGRYPDLRVPLAGEHQGMNVRLAVMAAEELKQRCGFTLISRRSILSGLVDLRRNTGLRGRLELLSPSVILDVAHNPDGAGRLTCALTKLLARKAVIVFGAMKDKDVPAMAGYFRELADLVIAVAPGTGRALDSRSVAEVFRAEGIPAIDGRTVPRGVSLGLREREPGEPLVITGSHYVVGEAISFIGEKVSGNRGKT